MKINVLYQLEDGTLIKIGDTVKITTIDEYDEQTEWNGVIENIYEYDGIVLEGSCFEIGWENIKTITIAP